MKLIRVKYGKKATPVELREYQINGVGPVGTIAEYKEIFPGETFYIFEKDELMNTIKSKVKLQEEYCEKNHVPFFAPKDKCWSCNNNIWEAISEEKASNELITGCPYCHRSFCD